MTDDFAQAYEDKFAASVIVNTPPVLQIPSMDTPPDPAQPKAPEVTEKQLLLDPKFAASARDIHLLFEGEPFDGDDQAAARYGIDAIGEFNYNFAGPAGIPGESGVSSPGTIGQAAALLTSGSQDQAKAFVYLMDRYDQLPNFTLAGTGRMIRGMVADPSIYTGFGTLGLGFAARKTGAMGIKKALVEIAKRPGTSAAVYTGVEAGAADQLTQAVEEQAGYEIDPVTGALRTAITSVVGGAAGGGLVKGGEMLAREFGPAVGKAVDEYIEGAPARLEEAKSGVTLGMGVDPMTVLDETIVAMSKKTPPAKNSDLIEVLNLRADQMKLNPKDRIQPSGQNQLFDTTPDAYQRNLPEQIETPVPRAPEGAKLPLGNRAAKVVEMTPQIADKLAEKMRPYLGTPAQYFYNTGPIIDKAVGLGVPEDVARKQLKRFALNYAATSPRTQTEPNLRSASIVSAKETQGINYDEIVGPGGEGINEKGYPMMIQPASPGKAEGIHRKLIEAVRAGGIDYNTNPKPATFAENVTGNLAGVTVDTHAIRGALDAMNEVEPGSIPEGFIAKEFREQYKSDPSTFNPATMVIDTLGDQKVGGVKMQTEYAVFSDLYKEAAKKLGVSPAEAQALGWFGSGKRTGLASDLKTVADLIDDRVDVTAQALNRPKEEVFIDFFSGKIPLLSLGGLTLLDTGAITDSQDGEEM